MPMERIWVVWLVWAAMVVGELQGMSGCLEKERMGFMELQKAIPPDQLTGLRRDSDCCSWDGVNCSATTGRVQRLTLCSPIVVREYPNYFLNTSLFLPFEELLELNLDNCGLHGLTNQQDLIRMKRLEALSINDNNLRNIDSLHVFANMKNLKYLDLNHNNMNIDLKGICEMNNIIELDLSFNAIRGQLHPCIGNLTQLQILNIGYNQISGNIPSTIGNLSHLSSLSLMVNYWSDLFSLHFLANNSKLENPWLSSYHNHFQVKTETQSWFPSFQLLTLWLTDSNLNKMSNSVIPTFLLHQSKLIDIAISHNKLQDTFPSWLLQNNSKLQILWMSNNCLTGNLIIPNFIHGLLDIDVSNNKIDGKLPDNLQMLLPSLVFLVISKTKFEGNLPSFGALHQLRFFDLWFNSFSGKLLKTLFANNSYLYYIDLSNNLLHGEISLNLTILPSLSYLDLNNNKFSGIIEELPFQSSSQLRVFDISNNLISTKLSNSIANFSSLEVLIVSNNSLKGGIPDKLCHMSKLYYLDISHNNFSGSCLRTLSAKFLYMRNCSISGVIPDELSINSTLIDIDLSYNHFSPGVPPNWIYSQPELQILLMAGLQLEGEISTHFCRLEKIKIIDLSHNNLNGSVPSCIFKRPSWVVESPDDYFLSMRYSFAISANRLFGVEFTTKGTSIKFQGRIVSLMSGMDLSSNKLSGQIPPQIGDSEAIHSLNLSNNRLWGSIPSSISRLREIESLDLSSNNLNGKIPPEIVSLNFLSIFNVSNNNLSGPIPNGGQFSNFDERNYGGNEFLCGPLLHRLCTTSSSPSTTPPDEQEDKDDETIFERRSFWWSFIVAYISVFILLVVLLGMDNHPSRVWFLRIDVVCSKLVCVFVKLKCVLRIK